MSRKKVLGFSLALVILLVVIIATLNFINNKYISTFNADGKGELEEKLNQVVKKYVENNKFSGTVLVAKDDSIIFNEGYGYAKRYFGRTQNTPETKYLIGSISKVFTASAIVKLEEDNLLRFDDKVTKYFPEYKGWEDITIHHLLNHTSGIENYYGSPVSYARYFLGNKTPVQIISRFKNKPLLFEPGTDYSYSNTNYIMLGSIIEKVTDMTYVEYLNKNILKPINLKNTGYQRKTKSIVNIAKGYTLNMILEINGLNLSNLYSAGGLYSSSIDLYNFCKSLQKDKLLNDNTKTNVRDDLYYGYGLMSQENTNDPGKIYFHTGGGPGICAAMYNLDDKDIIIIIIANNQSVSEVRKDMMIDLYKSIQ